MTASCLLPRTHKAQTYNKVKCNLKKLEQQTHASSSSTTLTRLDAHPKTQAIPTLSSATSTKIGATNVDEAVLIQSKEDLFAKVDPVDPRFPLYLGEWERSVPDVHTNLAADDMDEPHLKRKKIILDAHPEVKTLFGYEPKTKYIILALISTQLFLGSFLTCLSTTTSNWLFYTTFFALSYFIGGTITATLGVLIHECSHNLAAPTFLGNRIYGLITNIGIPFPIFASFRRYHLDHHAFQGVVGKDPDLPLDVEWQWIQNNRFLKLVWVFCFPFLYVFRGALMLKTPQKWELINWAWTIATDTLIYRYLGPHALLYIVASLWFGYGLHPGAAHFIQEHYTFTPGQETYSYYGSWNKILLNVGYHNEHHDFTQIPWSKLPRLYTMAKEYYAPLVCHTSWIRVIVDFILRKDVGPQSRLARDIQDHMQGRSTMKYMRTNKKAD